MSSNFQRVACEVVWEEAKALFVDNPCQIRRNDQGIVVCMNPEGPCCGNCEHLGDNGCTVQAPLCATWACESLRDRQPKDWSDRLDTIRQVTAEILTTRWIRASTDEILQISQGYYPLA